MGVRGDYQDRGDDIARLEQTDDRPTANQTAAPSAIHCVLELGIISVILYGPLQW
jgi:hypothetical protein